MKKITIILLITCFFTNAYCQLYVSSNKYVFAKNTVLYVKQDITLPVDSNIYLRNESQLVQGTTGASGNKGLGKVSVFQEGTTNNFAYNYWCSPVGVASALTGNEQFGIPLLRVPTSSTASNSITILPVSNLNSVAGTGSLSITPRWIWKFLSSVNYSEWIQVGSAVTINAGEGFTMKGVGGTDTTVAEGDGIQNNPGSKQRYEFSGKPNDGNIVVNVAAGKFTLTGNPYPSAIDVNAFLLDPGNTASTGIAYYWEHDKTSNSHYLVSARGGYGSYAAGTSTYVPATFASYNSNGTVNITGSSSGLVISRRFAPIGQGFMIEGATTGTVTIKNSHRRYYKESTIPTAGFEKNASNITEKGEDNLYEEKVIPLIRINTSINNDYTRQIALTFLPEATDGVDWGIDAKNQSDETLLNDAYFFLDNDGYVIQGLNFNVDKKIPLGVKATANTSFKFSLGEIKDFDSQQDIYIHDIFNNSFHNLKEGDYTVNFSATGVYNNRFEITFKNAALSNDSFAKNSFNIVQNNISKTLTIYNPESADIQSVLIYDISGKLLIEYKKLGIKPSYEFPTTTMSAGVYIVKLIDKTNKTFVQKIIVDTVK